MKSRHAIVCIISSLIPVAPLAQPGSLSEDNPSDTSSLTSAQSDTPAQLRIAAARQQLKADPKKVQAYNELAIALMARARETADTRYLKDADAALAQGLGLDAANFQLQKTQAALMLREQKYAQARELAAALNHRTPDDLQTYGFLAEADFALGDYAEAERNAQWMMNLRPNNIPALMIGAQLRTLYGDPQGAIDFLNQAYAETSPTEVEELAWISNQIASIQIESGKYEAAAQTLEQAERLFPDYPCTIENLARVRMGQKRASESVALWKRASAIDKDPHILFELAQAQQAAGETKAAADALADFERLATNIETTTCASRVDLILVLAGSASTSPKALKRAQEEIEVRHDVWTQDAYAWALFANGRYQEADATIQKAIAVGIQSSQIFSHAGHIAQELNRTTDAAKYFALAIQSNPSSEYGKDARTSLGSQAPGGNPESKPDSAVNTGSVPESDVSDNPVSPKDSTGSKDLSAVRNVNSPAPAFAKVPEALLTPRPTGTEQLIKRTQIAAERNTNDAAAYASLGAAYFQRARETGDVSDYQLAEQSLARSLELGSSDLSTEAALQTMAEVCMGEHRFSDALTYAHKALSLGTGDVSPFAIVGDAYADMGDYDRAQAAYERLTPHDMTLGPRAAYARDSRLAYLKFIAGDTNGAISLMKTAVIEGVEAQLPSENLAWLYYELGEFFTQAGDVASADSSYVTALNTHPGDYRALAALARLRANNGRYEEAIVLYQKAIAVVPMPTYIAELGDLNEKSGNRAEAKKQFALVEYIGLLGHINQVLHNRDLAVFYADHDTKLAEALDLAQKELQVRHDIYTWDALSWALYKNGKLAEAARASDKATRFGTKDALLLFHAGMIAEALGHHERAHLDFSKSLKINPHFHLTYASVAQQRLAALEAQTDSKEGSNDHSF